MRGQHIPVQKRACPSMQIKLNLECRFWVRRDKHKYDGKWFEYSDTFLNICFQGRILKIVPSKSITERLTEPVQRQ